MLAARFCFLAALALTLAITAARAQDNVSFPSLDADLTGGAPTLLTGLLHRPPGNGPFAAIVLMHGCGGMYRRDGSVARRDEAWAREFRDQGYIVLQVDSFGPRGIDSICTRIDRPIQPARERRRDAYGARAYLQGLAGVRADRIGLMGWSNGGSSTLWSVSNSKAAREILPPGPDFRAAIAFYPGCSAALQEPKWMTRVPLYVLIGEKDDWTPAPPCVDLARRTAGFGGPMEIIVYPDSHHGFDAPNTPLSVLGNIAATASGTATISTNPVARADAIRRASNYFARQLKD